jgi:hypothetical protein
LAVGAKGTELNLDLIKIKPPGTEDIPLEGGKSPSAFVDVANGYEEFLGDFVQRRICFALSAVKEAGFFGQFFHPCDRNPEMTRALVAAKGKAVQAVHGHHGVLVNVVVSQFEAISGHIIECGNHARVELQEICHLAVFGCFGVTAPGADQRSAFRDVQVEAFSANESGAFSKIDQGEPPFDG